MRDIVTGAHDIGDFQQQFLAQGAARMGKGEVVGGKTAGLEQGDCQGIPHDQGGCGTGGGRQVQGTGLGLDPRIQVYVRRPGQYGVGVAGHAHQPRAHALEQWQQGDDLGHRPGIGQGNDRVVGGDHAHIAVTGLAGVDEESGGAGAGQGRGNLARDVSRFAHARDDDPAAGLQQQLAGALEICADTLLQGGDRLGLHPDGTLR